MTSQKIKTADSTKALLCKQITPELLCDSDLTKRLKNIDILSILFYPCFCWCGQWNDCNWRDRCC